MKKLTTLEFVEKSKIVHGERYSYEKVAYKNNRTDVEIICPEHGSFMQKPAVHLRGGGCPKCFASESGNKKRKGMEDFLRRSKDIHGEKYDYSLVKVRKYSDKVEIICRRCGKHFMQSPTKHLSGRGCPFCAKSERASNHKLTTKQFIEKARMVHGDRYDYSKVNYKTSTDKVEIICPKHGVFEQTPNSHLNGNGCPQCGAEIARNTRKSNTEEFIKKALKVHGDKYNYDNTDYKYAVEKVEIKCARCGNTFMQTPNDHLNGCGCPHCGCANPKSEDEIVDFIKSIGINNVIKHDRTVIPPKELDIYLPDFKLGIEHNGNYWHSELSNKENGHLLKKVRLCERRGVKLLSFYEDEWKLKKDICKSMIMARVGKCKRVHARNTIVKRLDSPSEVTAFLNNNHIQGTTTFQYAYGLYDKNNELVSIMTFTKPRKNMGRTEKNTPYGMELSRFCNKIGTTVIGGASKLLKHFIEDHSEIKTVYSYSDNRISGGDMYRAIGFKFNGDVAISYFYITKGGSFITKDKGPYFTRIDKRRLRKSEFKKNGIDVDGKTEHELAVEHGFFRLYDAGKKSWVLELNK